ncbi:MAG: transcriptional regulator NrdR [Endomicrobium sp.]|jgi:transcriptional repressor NrdR|nr:transcriptional regulator NrdR [Endomicrobium sp.]
MKCPFCGSVHDQVLDSRSIEHTSAVKRRRECFNCKKRYTTFERPEKATLMVVKSDNRREPFELKKVLGGVNRSCRKRSISAETMDKIVSEIENEIMGEYVMEVPSSIIGEKILEKLWDIDLVAYIRFASVYRKFGDIDTFMKELKKLKKEHTKRQKTRVCSY